MVRTFINCWVLMGGKLGACFVLLIWWRYEMVCTIPAWPYRMFLLGDTERRGVLLSWPLDDEMDGLWRNVG